MMTVPNTNTRAFAGVPFATEAFESAVNSMCSLSGRNVHGLDVHLLNAYSISLAERDRDYRRCLENAGINFADGRPISLLTKFSSRPIRQIRGPRLFEAVLDRGRQQGLRHFFLGSSPETLAMLVNSVTARYPGLVVVGSESPPFRKLTEQELSEQDQRIRATLPDIVWVGLGTPKQDLEAARLAEAGFNAIAVGAAFDFSAGTKKEAPSWTSRFGVEWVFRLLTEPRRLWRRYLIGNTLFVYAAVRRRARR